MPNLGLGSHTAGRIAIDLFSFTSHEKRSKTVQLLSYGLYKSPSTNIFVNLVLVIKI
jgi:hypothetical protein